MPCLENLDCTRPTHCRCHDPVRIMNQVTVNLFSGTDPKPSSVDVTTVIVDILD